MELKGQSRFTTQRIGMGYGRSYLYVYIVEIRRVRARLKLNVYSWRTRILPIKRKIE